MTREFEELIFNNKEAGALYDEYRMHYENAQSREEQYAVIDKFRTIFQEQFGIDPGIIPLITTVELLQEARSDERKTITKPTQDIKSLKIVVMVLAALVIYLLMRKK